MSLEQEQDLYACLARAATLAPERPALAVGERCWSHGELFAAAARVAEELRRRGVRRGDRVALFAASGAELVVAQLATLRAGAAIVPIHLAYRPREIAHVLGDAEPRLLVCGREQLATASELGPGERGGVEAVLIAEELLAAAEGASRSQLEDAGARSEGSDPDDLALLLYTSGTTGRSKGAMLRHGNVVAMIEALRRAWAWSEADRLLLALPLFHLHGLVVGLFTALASGAAVRAEARFEAGPILEGLAAGEASLFFGVPTIYVRLVDELRRRNGEVDLSAVRLFVSGSAPLAPETFEAFRDLTGQTILERYGMTETGMLLSNPLDGPRLAGTVGVPLPRVEARVVDASGRPLPDGEEGEIEVRGPSVFGGYWRAPDKSAECFREDPSGGARWFRTGDLGRRDQRSGHFVLLGRLSELILSGGFNVYPREVEEVLLRLPGVLEAAVVGAPHAEFGQSPIAYLVLDRPLAETALDAYCQSELAPFKRPRRFVVLDALPRNALGKVEKRRLAAARIP